MGSKGVSSQPPSALNILTEVPVIGAWLKQFVRGGNDLGTLTVSRFFVAHVFLLPAAIFAFVGAHVFLFRKAGAAGPPVPPRPEKTESFYPRQVLMDIAFTAMLIRCARPARLVRARRNWGPKPIPRTRGSCRARVVLRAGLSMAEGLAG